MQFELIDDDEKFEKEIDGATFFCKRVPSGIRNRMLTACTSKRNGVTDWGKLGQMLIGYGLLGWKNVNMRGVPIEFSKELIERIPDDAQGELVKVLGENLEETEAALKNSPTTQSSKPSIEA